MKRRDTIELEIETEYEIEPYSPGYFNAMAGEGEPPSGGYAELTSAELAWKEPAGWDREGACKACKAPYSNHKGKACFVDKRVDIIDALTDKQRESLEEGAYNAYLDSHDERDREK